MFALGFMVIMSLCRRPQFRSRASRLLVLTDDILDLLELGVSANAKGEDEMEARLQLH
jgi:hypothetical protein